MPNIITKIEAYTIPPKNRHATIFQTYHDLLPNQSFELINDHDPLPLYYQFQAEFSGQFSWEYLEKGPDMFRVLITKIEQ